MGLFIAFEGVEGSGKSTQSKVLVDRLTGAGFPNKLIREPGGTFVGERVRELLQGDNEITSLTELFLFNSARASLVELVLRPALARGEVVVCDRYIYSTVAYQGYGRGLDMKQVQTLNRIATGGLEPHLVILMDLPPQVGFERKSDSALDRIEQERHEFHERVRQGYLEQARQQPERWLVMDSAQSIETLSDAIWKRVLELLNR